MRCCVNLQFCKNLGSTYREVCMIFFDQVPVLLNMVGRFPLLKTLLTISNIF